MSNHLQHATVHPNIKGGELFIATFTDMVVDGELADGIGILKPRAKSDFYMLAVRLMD